MKTMEVIQETSLCRLRSPGPGCVGAALELWRGWGQNRECSHHEVQRRTTLRPAKSLRERRSEPGRVRKAAQENLRTAVIQEYPSPGLTPRFCTPRAAEERQPSSAAGWAIVQQFL